MTDLREAARATLRAGTVRVQQRHVETDWWVDVGFADLARGRTLVHTEGPDPEIAERLTEWARRRNARIAEDIDDGPAWTLFTGDAFLMRGDAGEPWNNPGRGDPHAGGRGRGDPLRIVQQLAEADGVETEGDTFRFTDDVRYAGRFTLDAKGRIEGLTWAPVARRNRPRSLVGRRDRPGDVHWTSLFLTDYGIAVDLPLPEIEPPIRWWEWPGVLWRIWQHVRRGQP